MAIRTEARQLRITILLAAMTGSAFAVDPGFYDPTFSGDGTAIVSFDLVTKGSDLASAVLIYPDGGIALAGLSQAGTTGVPSDHEFAFVKLDASGALVDPWGTLGNGRSVITFDAKGSEIFEELRDAALDANGRLVAVGTRGDFSPIPLAVRLNSLGTPDSSFTGDGKVVLNGDTGEEVAVLSTGDVVVVTSTADLILSDLDMRKLVATSATDGTALDAEFGGAGILSFNSELAYDLLVLPDDRIVLATSGLGLSPRLRSYDSDGETDVTFGGGDGIVDLDLSLDGLPSSIVAMAIDPRGRIVALGWFNDPDKMWCLARVLPNGDFDSTFGFQGVATIGYDTDLSFTPRALAAQSDGKIVVVGDEGGPVVARYDSTGDLDTSFFSPNGMRSISYESSTDIAWAEAVAIGADGRIVVAGSSQSEDDLGNRNFAVARIESGVVFCDGFESQGIYGKTRWSAQIP